MLNISGIQIVGQLKGLADEAIPIYREFNENAEHGIAKDIILISSFVRN